MTPATWLRVVGGFFLISGIGGLIGLIGLAEPWEFILLLAFCAVQIALGVWMIRRERAEPE